MSKRSDEKPLAKRPPPPKADWPTELASWLLHVQQTKEAETA